MKFRAHNFVIICGLLLTVVVLSVYPQTASDPNGVYINKRPLKDFAASALKQVDDKSVDLSKPFKVAVKGTLDTSKDGLAVLKNLTVVKTKGDPVNDPAIEKLAHDAIIAVRDAGWFGYLKNFKAKEVIITLEQNSTNVIAMVRADQPSENEAKMAASTLNMGIAVMKSYAKAENNVYADKLSVTSDGKGLMLKFQSDRTFVHELIRKELDKLKASNAAADIVK